MKNKKKIVLIKSMIIVASGLVLMSGLMPGCSKKNGGCTNMLALNYDKNAEEDDRSCL